MANYPRTAQDIEGATKVSDVNLKEVLEDMLKELKKITFRLSIIADVDTDSDDDNDFEER